MGQDTLPDDTPAKLGLEGVVDMEKERFAGKTALERLSSGLRINSARDDAAGLAISEKLRGQISGISQSMRNAQDAVSSMTGRRAITVAGYRDGDRAVIEVRDTGPGIPPEVMPRLFEPLVTTKSGGTGLGLVVAQSIVSGLRGTLAV